MEKAQWRPTRPQARALRVPMRGVGAPDCFEDIAGRSERFRRAAGSQDAPVEQVSCGHLRRDAEA